MSNILLTIRHTYRQLHSLETGAASKYGHLSWNAGQLSILDFRIVPCLTKKMLIGRVKYLNLLWGHLMWSWRPLEWSRTNVRILEKFTTIPTKCIPQIRSRYPNQPTCLVLSMAVQSLMDILAPEVLVSSLIVFGEHLQSYTKSKKTWRHEADVTANIADGYRLEISKQTSRCF